MNNQSKNCLSYWFPKLKGAGILVPETIIVKTRLDLSSLLDFKRPDGLEGFLTNLSLAVKKIGLPCFLRTGQGSGKHLWRTTCYLTDQSMLLQHVGALVEWSYMVSLEGLDTSVWAVREMLPVRPVAIFQGYEGLPLVREVRGFIADGKVECLHPYWPKDAIYRGFGLPLPKGASTMYRAVSQWSPAEDDALQHVLLRVAGAIKGEWSVDILDTAKGWYVTDMAEAGMSFHWPTCHKTLTLRRE